MLKQVAGTFLALLVIISLAGLFGSIFYQKGVKDKAIRAQHIEELKVMKAERKEAYGKCLLSLKYEDYECYLKFKQ